MELLQASHQWATRPADERFTSLDDMLEHFASQKRNSKERTVANRSLKAIPNPDHKGLVLQGPDGSTAAPTNWAFGQLAGLAKAPAGYLRDLPAEIAADCINWGIHSQRTVSECGILLQRQDSGIIQINALTGPRYGRVWNADITATVIDRFGNGTGTDGSDWSVPGEFGQQVDVTKANTTLFAGDRDMFIFLADEKNRVTVPNRRKGQSGEMARGFFISNSEVGSATLSISTFLFDYVCCNRIVWGAQKWKQVRVRHSAGAPLRWAEEVMPALKEYREDSTGGITEAIQRAQNLRLDDPTEFLAKRFGQNLPALLQDISLEQEERPIETIWDAVCAVTEYAKRSKWQDERTTMERNAGKLLDLTAV